MRKHLPPTTKAATIRQPLSASLPLGEGLVLSVILFIVLAMA